MMGFIEIYEIAQSDSVPPKRMDNVPKEWGVHTALSGQRSAVRLDTRVRREVQIRGFIVAGIVTGQAFNSTTIPNASYTSPDNELPPLEKYHVRKPNIQQVSKLDQGGKNIGQYIHSRSPAIQISDFRDAGVDHFCEDEDAKNGKPPTLGLPYISLFCCAMDTSALYPFEDDERTEDGFKGKGERRG
ncbi:hypothetical protein BGZ63DRAFT_402142 [Mariannaea sp. PMI_226]|nr:hypothetical protein BGZ63DRAFT_402142 [Mariannaea sp. PMI_226]